MTREELGKEGILCQASAPTSGSSSSLPAVALQSGEGAEAWKPIRRGDVYCSPRCGFDCTYAAFERANKEAAALVARLGGEWKPHVWENCGWRYKIALGVCQITVTMKNGGTIDGDWTVNGYIAWINTHPQFISKSRPTPEEAFREALDQMQDVFTQLSDAVSSIRLTEPKWIEEQALLARGDDAHPQVQQGPDTPYSL